MKTDGVLLDELVAGLNATFGVEDWESDPAMSHWVPYVYEGIGYPYGDHFEADFGVRYNGLMLRAGEWVRKVYCAAFPCPDVLETLLAHTVEDALLFLHHPVDLEVSGKGFLPIPPETLERLQAAGVSIYACHAPMDCHDEMGTNASIVQALDVRVTHHFAEYGNGFAGRVGTIRSTSLEDVIARGKALFGVERAEIGGASPARIDTVAVVAGGGDDPELFAEAEALGAQVYITGEWITRTTPPDKAGREWAEANRAACREYAEASAMAFLAFSHAATEFVVMTRHMVPYFQAKGLAVDCLAQEDWWR